MDEITRCLEVLGLKPGATEEEIKRAYRELAMVWHPDRFPADSPLQQKAEANFKEINSAYEFLQENGFGQTMPAVKEDLATETEPSPGPFEPESPPPDEEQYLESESEPASRGNKIVGVLLTSLVLISVAGWWVWHRTHSPAPIKVVREDNAVATNTVEVPVPIKSAPQASNAPAPVTAPGTDLLPNLRFAGERRITRTDDGSVITGESRLQTREEYSPPFVVHAVAKTDLTNIRLHYAQGEVILNWEGNPDELRFHDPATGQITPFGGEGRVPVNEWQDIEWFVETNSSRVLVNGKERAHIRGNYAAIAELPSIGTCLGATVTVKKFEIRKLAPELPQRTLNLAAGLVLYFPFDKDEFNVVTDQSGFRNNGAVQGAKFVPDGKVGGAMHFTGNSHSGNVIIVPHSASLVSMQRTRQFTLCCWIKPSSLPPEYSVILAKGGNEPPKAFGGYELDLQNGDEDNIFLISGKNGLFTRHARELVGQKQTDEWIHLAVTVNTATGVGKIYINGERAGDETTSADWRAALLALPNSLFIGGPDPTHNANRAWFDGLIDELRLYTRVLSAEEIRSLPGFKNRY